jgi:hypothetical protein
LTRWIGYPKMTEFSKLTYLKDLRGQKMSAPAYRVLLAVFNYTNESGENAHPGEKRLAEDTGLSQRSVRDYLKWLTENGYLIKGKRGHGSGGQGIATVYALDLPAESRRLATGRIEEPTGRIEEPTGEITSSYRQDYVELPAKSRPLSDLISDPLTDPVPPDYVTSDVNVPVPAVPDKTLIETTKPDLDQQSSPHPLLGKKMPGGGEGVEPAGDVTFVSAQDLTQSDIAMLMEMEMGGTPWPARYLNIEIDSTGLAHDKQEHCVSPN